MSICDVSKLREELIKCFETSDGVALDLGGVNACDAAGVQLLCAACKTAGEGGKRFVIENASEAAIHTAALSGLRIYEIQNPKSKEGG